MQVLLGHAGDIKNKTVKEGKQRPNGSQKEKRARHKRETVPGKGEHRDKKHQAPENMKVMKIEKKTLRNKFNGGGHNAPVDPPSRS